MLILTNNILNIYNFETNETLKDTIQLNETINYFDFHCSNESILYICAGPNAVIYEIENQKIKELCVIEGHFTEITYASFNPFKPNIFLTFSKNDTIKIYDITNDLPMNLIVLDIPSDEEVIWSGKYIGVLIDKKEIMYFEFMNFDKKNIKKYTERYIEDFHFLDDDSLIVITDDSIELVTNNYKMENYHLNTQDDILSTFFSNKNEILIIIYRNEIKGFFIKKKCKLLFNFQQTINYYINNPIYINENLLCQNEICNIYQFYSGKMLSYSIIDNSINQNNNKIENNYKNINIKEIKKIISDIPLLISNNNNDYSSYHNPKNKNYFNIDEIKNELILIKCRNLLERKKIVEEYVQKFNKDYEEDIQHKYIFLLKLLINDNTNINLLKEYLIFLKVNNNKLKSIFQNNYEKFEDELNYYSKVLTSDANEELYGKKIESQHTNFIHLINTILGFNKDYKCNIQKFENFLEKCDKYFDDEISYFNMNINFSNEQIFYYRNINMIKYHLKELYNKMKKEKDKTEFLQSALAKIQDNIRVCKDDFINYALDIKKINSLLILIIFNSEQREFMSGYNLLNSAQENINNLIKSNDKYIIDFMTIYDHINIPLDLIKKFYKNILPLECFKSIYLTLYGDNEFYPFENKEFTEYFVDYSFEVLCLPLKNNLGLTDKFSMKTYFIPFLSKITTLCTDIEKEILRNGSFIKTGAHEIGHNFVNIKFCMENCRIPIETPPKQSLKESEGGKYVEFALFGKTLDEIRLDEALFILNEKNYKQSFLEFQNAFKDIKQEDIKVEGVFENLCQKININPQYVYYSKSIYIVPRLSHFKKPKISCQNKNDIIGRISSYNDYKKILMDYFDN